MKLEEEINKEKEAEEKKRRDEEEAENKKKLEDQIKMDEQIRKDAEYKEQMRLNDIQIELNKLKLIEEEKLKMEEKNLKRIEAIIGGPEESWEDDFSKDTIIGFNESSNIHSIPISDNNNYAIVKVEEETSTDVNIKVEDNTEKEENLIVTDDIRI